MYDRKLFPPSVNVACKAAEQGEEAARCLDQGLPAERLYYGDCDGEETDDSESLCTFLFEVTSSCEKGGLSFCLRIGRENGTHITPLSGIIERQNVLSK
jgi:hypothetical protein